MIKKKYSLNQLTDVPNQQSSVFIRNKQPFLKCPNCGSDSFVINNEYQIGYCSNKSCNVFTDLYSKRNKKRNSTLGLIPMINESINHLSDDIMQKELSTYSLSKEVCKQYSVGYYPAGYWVKPREDWTFGKVLFPLTSWTGELINICAKHIGSENKLRGINSISYAYPKNGIFNNRGIWNEEVHIFLDPIDCLIALENKIKNSIFVNNIIDLPKVIVFEKAYIWHREYNFDKIESIKNILKTKNIDIEIVTLDGLNIINTYQNILSKKNLTGTINAVAI